MAKLIAKWVLPTPGGPRKITFTALQEAELMQRVDLLALDRGLEAEVEVFERFDGRSREERIAAWSRRLLRNVISAPSGSRQDESSA